MPFPVIKLAYLAMKQISKPLANVIKRRAKNNRLLRNYVLIPTAQVYHSVETTFRLRLLGLGKTSKVEKLNEQMAMELGAEMLGEMLIFSVAAGTLFYEYQRQSNKEQNKEDTQNQRLESLEETVQDLGLKVAEQSTQLKELTRLLHARSVPRTIKDSTSGTVLQVDKPKKSGWFS